MLTKLCTKCKEVKDIEQFNKRKSTKSGRQSWCKPCCLDSCSKWEKTNRKKRMQKWRKISPEKSRANDLRKKYGLTIEQHDRMFIEQDNKCMVCKKDQSELNHKLNVDHCHTTGKVRDLLCS